MKMVKGVDHVGILVKSIDDTTKIYQDLFGAKSGKVETIADQGIKSVLVDVGGPAKLELLEPLPGSGMEKALEKTGGGLHHIAFAVDDVDKELDSLGIKGVALISKKALAAPGVKYAFIHPKATSGILVELTQEV
jgi:methylmalonyl-CoA epimerase